MNRLRKERGSPRDRRRGRLATAGLTPLQERIFNILALLVAGLLISAWVLTWIAIRQTPLEHRAEDFGEPHTDLIDPEALESEPPPRPEPPGTVTGRITETLFSPDRINLAFINEAIIRMTEPLGGYSGDLRALFKMPGEEIDELAEEGVRVVFRKPSGERMSSEPGKAPQAPGVYQVELQRGGSSSTIEDLHVIVLVPFEKKQNGRIGNYRLGTWPFERGGKPKTARYADPPGFIRVTRENVDTPVSTHFTLGDFLTKGQDNIWPKYLVLDPLLVDKLELIIDGLQDRGVPVRNVKIMSGFRHPAYNSGGGNTAGRASLSRHQYGDASDIFVDNDFDNWSDDVTGDGKLTLADAELIEDIADEIERRYPALVGGVGIYPACCGHGPMTHVDVRGYRARWYY